MCLLKIHMLKSESQWWPWELQAIWWGPIFLMGRDMRGSATHWRTQGEGGSLTPRERTHWSHTPRGIPWSLTFQVILSVDVGFNPLLPSNIKPSVKICPAHITMLGECPFSKLWQRSRSCLLSCCRLIDKDSNYTQRLSKMLCPPETADNTFHFPKVISYSFLNNPLKN